MTRLYLMIFVLALPASCHLIDPHFAEGVTPEDKAALIAEAEALIESQRAVDSSVAAFKAKLYRLKLEDPAFADAWKSSVGWVSTADLARNLRDTMLGNLRAIEAEAPPVEPPPVIEPEIPPTARVIYVDAPGGPTVGDDANDGATPETPVASCDQVKRLVFDAMLNQTGREVWVLFNRGDTWFGGFGDAVTIQPAGVSAGKRRAIRGEDADHPFVVTAYGDGPAPEFNLAWNQMFWNATGGAYVTFRGLRVTSNGTNRATRLFGTVTDYRFEGCDFDGSWIAIEENGQTEPSKRPARITFSDTVVRNMIAPFGSNATDFQGIFATGCDELVIERCVFDLIGWTRDAAGNLVADKRNHGSYISGRCGPAIVRGCIYTRCAGAGVQIRGGGECIDTYIGGNGLIGLNIGWMRTSEVESYPDGPVPITVRNVVIHHRGGNAMQVGNCSKGTIDGLTVLADGEAWGDGIAFDALSNGNVHGLHNLTASNMVVRSVRWALNMQGGEWDSVSITGKLDGAKGDVNFWSQPGDGSDFSDVAGGLKVNATHADLSGLVNVTITDAWVADVLATGKTGADLVEQYRGHK